MNVQVIDVAYNEATGKIEFFHPNGNQFNGDLECPPEGCVFDFKQKAGESGWTFDRFVSQHLTGPAVSFTQVDTETQITVTDPGNGEDPESEYRYTIWIKTSIGPVSIDPKIKNKGGNTVADGPGIVATGARYLLGVGFLVFGANAFLQFMPALELPEAGTQFLGLMWESGYFNWVAILKIVAGVLLLVGRYVPLALTLLGPILVNILLFHISFDPTGIVMGLIFTALWFVVFWSRKDDFKGIFSAD